MPRRIAWVLGMLVLLLVGWARAADHNDPNAVNSIFADVDVSAADLYDLFGFPSDDRAGGEKVVVALTFASVPKAGVFDTDMLYRLRIYPNERVVRPSRSDHDLDTLLKYFETVTRFCRGIAQRDGGNGRFCRGAGHRRVQRGR
jgi:hypothetical protein